MHIITPYDPWTPKKKKTWQEELWEQNQIAEVEAQMLAEIQHPTLPSTTPHSSLAVQQATAAGNAAGAGGKPVLAFAQRNTLLNPAFTFTSSSKVAPSNVTFVNTTTNGGPGTLSYAWNLGSGSLTSVATTPSVQPYTVPGTYTVTLTVTELSYNTVKATTGQFTLT